MHSLSLNPPPPENTVVLCQVKESGDTRSHPHPFFFFFLISIGVELLYNVLVSAVQQSESAMRIHTSPAFGFSSPFRSHRALSRVPCAIQQVLVSYLFYTK